jgi:hypothetical protein
MSGLRSALRSGKSWSLAVQGFQIGPVAEVQRAARIIESRAAGLVPVVLSSQDLNRLKKRLISASEKDVLNEVSKREWRYAPWVFWHDDDRVAADRKIVQAFLDRVVERKSPTWIKSLVNAYLARFPAKSKTLVPISHAILKLLTSGRWPSLQVWVTRHRNWKFFDINEGPVAVARHLLESDTIDGGLQEMGLDGAIAQGASFNFLAVAYSTALEMARKGLQSGAGSQAVIVDRLIEWSAPLPGQQTGVRYPELLNQLAGTMLLPWRDRAPEPGVQEKIKAYLLMQVGDPRIKRGAWQGVDNAAIEVLLRWLAGDTLAQFFNLLSQTADDIWEYRKRFWTAYYRKGAITEAWFALGPQARHLGTQLKRRSPGLDYASLNGAGANQSVLVMRLGDFTVAEWSHSGACRFWSKNDPRAPRLYQKAYAAPTLRNDCAFDQAHHASEYGTWQRKISDYIRRETSITVTARDWS